MPSIAYIEYVFATPNTVVAGSSGQCLRITGHYEANRLDFSTTLHFSKTISQILEFTRDNSVMKRRVMHPTTGCTSPPKLCGRDVLLQYLGNDFSVSQYGPKFEELLAEKK